MDSIALMTSALVASMVAVLLFVLPGFALGPVVLPGATSPLTKAGRAAGVSLLVGFASCTVLARLGALTGPAVVLVLLAVTGVGLLARRRVGPGRIVGARSPRRWLGTVVGAGLVIALVVLPLASRTGGEPLPRSSTTWYYIHLAQTMADAGAIPERLGEWGASRLYQTDYLPITAHTAAALLLLPGGQLAAIETYRLATLLLAALFATLLLRRWVSSWVALLGAIALLGTVRLDGKFDAYRPETVALTLALFSLWMAERAFTERDRRPFVVALGGAALVWMSHAEVFLVMAPLLVGMAVARVVIPGRHGRRLTLGGLAPLGAATGLVIGGVFLGTVAGWVATGGVGVLGYLTGAGAGAGDGDAARAVATSTRGRPGEIPAGWTFTDDPTWDFYVASVAPGLVGTNPPDAFTDAILLPRSILHVWPGLDARTRSGAAVLAGLLVAPILAWPFLDRRRRRMLVTVLVFGVTLTLGSWLLYQLADTYVPQRTGGRRLMPYLLLVPVGGFTLLLWGLGRVAAPAWRALLPGRGRALAAGAALALITVGAVAAESPRAGAVDEADASLSQTGHEAYRWIAAELPADARILANAYTDGSIAAVTGRMGIVDGRAVYLEDPGFLAEATALCLGARVVFGDPASGGAATYLERERVTHLVVAGPGADGSDLGGYPLFATDLNALRADPGIRLLRSFGGDRVMVFEVARDTALH